MSRSAQYRQGKDSPEEGLKLYLPDYYRHREIVIGLITISHGATLNLAVNHTASWHK